VFLELNANGRFIWLKYAAQVPVLDVLADMLVRDSMQSLTTGLLVSACDLTPQGG
jgi:hypothetical protein